MEPNGRAERAEEESFPVQLTLFRLRLGLKCTYRVLGGPLAVRCFWREGEG